MKRVIFIPFLLISGLALLSFVPWESSVQSDSKVILVDIEVSSPQDVKFVYSDKFDKKRVELPIEIDDPLNTLEDFSLGEASLEGPGCFMPEMKIIFERYTYIFSLYCTSVKKYRNSAPFKPSGKMVRNDLRMTESVLDYLQRTRKKYFGAHFDPNVAKKFVKSTKLEELDLKVDDSDLYKNDDEEEDKEIEKDAIDKEGWFDETKDPELEIDETSDVDEDD